MTRRGKSPRAFRPPNAMADLSSRFPHLADTQGLRKRTAASWASTGVTLLCAVAALLAGGGHVWLVGRGSTDLGDAPSASLGIAVPPEFVQQYDAALFNAHNMLRLHSDWNLTALDVPSARRYLLHHPRLSKHLGAFLQAALGAVPIPEEHHGHAYIACAAGGPIAFDWFAQNINASQTVNKKMSRLSRRFRYETTLHSIPDQDVIDRCGPAVDMTAPAPTMLLPYSDTFQLELEILERWTSNRDAAAGANGGTGAGAGNTVSILPFSQWSVAEVSFRCKLKATRGFEHWLQQHGAEEVQAMVGGARWAKLQAQAASGEVVVGEVKASCNFADPVQTLRCFHTNTMVMGEPPLVTSDMFLEWLDVNWLDDHDVSPVAVEAVVGKGDEL